MRGVVSLAHGQAFVIYVRCWRRVLTGPFVFYFFFQAEDGIRDLVRSRGLGDVYKRQAQVHSALLQVFRRIVRSSTRRSRLSCVRTLRAVPAGNARMPFGVSDLTIALTLSLIHISEPTRPY